MTEVLVIISANQEWRVVKQFFSKERYGTTPYGEYFRTSFGDRKVTFMFGGWGKISAASSTQYGITHFKPDLVINLGTCGGFSGRAEVGEIILAEETLVYDIIEQMSDPEEAIHFYQVRSELDWLPARLPLAVRRGRLVSADRDIVVEDIPMLVQKYGAFAADWESGAINWVCLKNNVRCLILRGVTDLVGAEGGQAYGKVEVFTSGTHLVMQTLLAALPGFVQLI
jgi:adenosylhomocysteine nucleosidase